MRARSVGISAGLAVVGGALPWLASFGSISVLENHPGLPLLIGQTFVMPIVVVAIWLLARRLWPELSRVSALLMIAGVWLVPGVWMLLSGSRTHPATPSGVASFLASGPMILSVYMLNSIGLAVAVLSLALAALRSKPEIRHGA